MSGLVFSLPQSEPSSTGSPQELLCVCVGYLVLHPESGFGSDIREVSVPEDCGSDCGCSIRELSVVPHECIDEDGTGLVSRELKSPLVVFGSEILELNSRLLGDGSGE